MAAEVYEFTVTTPAGVLSTAPQIIDLSMPPRTVRRVEIRVPPGPAGNVGFALGAAGVPVIPNNAGAWIVTDDEVIPWDLEGVIDSGAWQAFTYNTGLFAHSIYVRFLVDLIDTSAGRGVSQPLLTAAQLAPVPDAATVSLPGGVIL